MSEPFLALFTHSEVFLSLLEGLVLRPLLFDFPRSTMQTERLNDCLLILRGEKDAFEGCEDWTDLTPFMSCNARLTIYILFSEMFFGDNAMLMAYSMYLIGIVVAIVVSAVIHLLDRKKSVNYLMIELPEYKLPDSRTVAIYVWEKVKDYLEKAGTTIFIATLVIWLLLNFGPMAIPRIWHRVSGL